VELYGVPAGRVFWEGDPTIGGNVTLHVTGETGQFAFLLGAFGTTSPYLLPGLGTLELDPASVFILAQDFVSGEGSFALPINLPDDPSLSGLNLPLQGILVDGPGPLSGSTTPLDFLELD